MPITRQYDFTVGPETAVLPTVGTPSDDNDTISKGFADANYALLTDFGNDVADIAALKAVAEADRADGQTVAVRSTNKLYIFDSGSAASGDDDAVVEPNSGTGRWIRSDGEGGSATLSADVIKQDDPRIGKVLHGLETNAAQLNRIKFNPLESAAFSNRKFINAFDPFFEDEGSRSATMVDNTAATNSSDADAYMGVSNTLNSGEERKFVCKKGENYFALYIERTGGSPTDLTITVDGVAINTLGLTDENGTAYGAKRVLFLWIRTK